LRGEKGSKGDRRAKGAIGMYNLKNLTMPLVTSHTTLQKQSAPLLLSKTWKTIRIKIKGKV